MFSLKRGIVFYRPVAWVFALLSGLAIGVAILGSSAYASTYGSGSYGACAYGTGCTVVTAPPPPSTCTTGCTQTTSPPLQVSINLTDGQSVPDSGYAIVVTPLGGPGSAINQVQFFIDSTPVSTITPSSDGTVSWTWHPTGLAPADVRIVVLGKDGQTINRDFHVIVVAQTATTPKPTPSSPSSQASDNLLQRLERGIRTLPNVIKYDLPYFLFLILVADIVFLLLHMRREISESKRLAALIAREREMGELKKTFIALASHYLRTPLSIIRGAISLFSPSDKAAELRVANLQSDARALGEKINFLLEPETDSQQTATVGAATENTVVSVWRQPMLLIPVTVIGVVAFSFDYLAQRAGSFSLGEVDLIIQVIVYGSSAVVLYVAVRQLALRRRNNVISSQILATQAAFNSDRDAFITSVADGLNGLVGTLEQHVNEAGPSPARKFLDQGTEQLHNVVTKFVAAAQLRGSSSSTPAVSSELSALCAPVFATLNDKASAKHIAIKLTNDVSLKLQSPELLSVVIQTILDNAIDYSPTNGTVAISAQELNGELTLAITDHGPGIPEDKKYALFQAFARVEGVQVFNREGMGFSLYLDRLIMFYLHGDIAIQSAKPQGTTVLLTLPSAVVAG